MHAWPHQLRGGRGVRQRAGGFEAIEGIALSTDLRDPLAIAEVMMTHPSIPMLGCEHSYLTAAAFMAALRNHGKSGVSNEQIMEAMDRTRKISISGFCALAGTCDITSGLAALTWRARNLGILFSFKDVLLKRSAYRSLRKGYPFYIMVNIRSNSFVPFKVAWKRMGNNIDATVSIEPDPS